MKCWLVPIAIVGMPGVTANEARFAAFTVSNVLPGVVPDIAVIVTVPSFSPVAKPLTVMEAIVFADELHVTVFVMSWLVPSENVPVAVYCCCTPNGIVILSGVTAIELSVAVVTVNAAAFDVTEPDVAVIIVVPAFISACAVPCVPIALLMVAIVVSEEFQVTVLVTSFVLPSAKVPFAVKKVEVEAAIDLLVARYPQYRNSRPGGPVVAVTIHRLSGWSGS